MARRRIITTDPVVVPPNWRPANERALSLLLLDLLRQEEPPKTDTDPHPDTPEQSASDVSHAA